MREPKTTAPPAGQGYGDAKREHRRALGGEYSAGADTPTIPDRPGRHRVACPRCDKGKRDRALSMLVEPDGSACWLCWRCQWSGSNRSSLAETPAERQRRAEARRQRRREEQQQRKQAADRARRLWIKARPADANHPYLQAKAVTPGHARQLGPRLVLPIVSLDGELHSLQFIGPDGSKRFIRGGRKQGAAIPAGGQRGAGRILIAEGWATARTLSDMEPQSLVLAALDAGNLKPVATDCRNRWPDATIIVCGDNDATGRTKAREAALAAQALVAIPDGPDGTDWNDAAKGVAA